MKKLLKPKGTLFIHVHLRKRDELNETHPVLWDEVYFRDIFKESFDLKWHRIEDSDEVNGDTYRTLYAKFVKV